MPSFSRPNILLVQADQLRYDALGVNGNALVRTPSIDRLATDGINFRNAFCAVPVCVPVRNSMLYGCWPSRHLCIGNSGTEAPRPPPPNLPAYDQVLRDAGYRLLRLGKIQEGQGPNDPGAFHTCIPNSEYTRWRADQNLPPSPRTNGWFGEPDPAITPEQSRLGWGAGRIIDMLKTAALGDEPFFIRWDTSEPHLPNIVPEPYASMIQPADVPPWLGFGDDLTDKPYIQRQQLRTWGLEGWSWQQWAPTVARYLGEISLLDAQFGRILHAVEQLGLADNTVVVFTTDHGDLCGGHGMIDKHFVMYEDVLHIPLIIRSPGGGPGGIVSDEFVINAIDLARTFCELAHAPVPDTFQGESLLPILRGDGGTGRQDVFATYHASQFGLFSQRMVRDDRWKYIWNATDIDELYDLHSDPGELRNLAEDPACKPELARLRQRLVQWMETTEDPLLNQWTRALLEHAQ